MTAPQLSVIVICHDMPREAARTLQSLATPYQQGVNAAEYEVIVIDNGSTRPLHPPAVAALGPGFSYRYLETASVSPVAALNLGAQMARGDYITFIVDGARMATPGLVRATLDAVALRKLPFLCSLSWHLGPDVQNRSMLEGYNQQVEDQLLDSIDWPEDGYRLFEISTLAQSSMPGFLSGFPSECSWLGLSREGFDRLGGYDPAFKSPGGGLVNHDLIHRAAQAGIFDFTVLLGEGVFHQFHGGIATNVERKHHPMPDFLEEFRAIRGVDYQRQVIDDVAYFGKMPAAARRFIAS